VSAAALIGGIAAGAPAPSTEALARYGAALGLAFQIMDDVLDVTQTTEALGKTAGRDAALRKSTYPALLGVAGATQRAEALIGEACASLSDLRLLTPTMESMAHFVVRRSA
jgi:geranylgeranyl pyrophosphate synthase